jgi:hypothetical protein
MGMAFTPADGNSEFFRVDFVHASAAKPFDCPTHGAVGGRRTGDAAADGVGEIAQIFFKR